MIVYIVVYEPDNEDVYEICKVFANESDAKTFIIAQENPDDFYIHEGEVL